MAELLQKLHQDLDNPDLNVQHLTNEFRVIVKNSRNEMEEEKDEEGLKFLQLENELLHIHKSVEDGLQGKFGSTNPFNETEYEYIQQRYNATQNLFLKTEYGLILLLSKKNLRNDFKKDLAASIRKLIGNYWNLSNQDVDIWIRLMSHFFKRMKDAFLILKDSGETFEEEFEEFTKMIKDMFLQCEVSDSRFSSFSGFIVDLATDFKKHVKNVIQSREVITRLEMAIENNKDEDPHEVISLAKKILRIQNVYKISSNVNPALMIACIHESFGDSEMKLERWWHAEKEYQDALQFFRFANERESIRRMEYRIHQNRGRIPMGEISQKLDEKHNYAINANIEKISNSSPKDIIIALAGGYGIVEPYKQVLERAQDKSQATFLNDLCTKLSIDKYGNVIKVYHSEADNQQYKIYSSLDFSLQISMQQLWQIFKLSVRNKTLTFDDLKSHLEQSWYNEPVEWFRNGKLTEVIPLPALISPLKLFFEEVSKAIDSKGEYIPDLVCCNDSLVLKIEYLLRNMCKRLDIPTFKYTFDGHDHMLAEEKTLSGLLSELESHLPLHIIELTRFITNEKGGKNLRNRLGHGLIDYDEYHPGATVLLQMLVLQLSFIQIVNTEHPVTEPN